MTQLIPISSNKQKEVGQLLAAYLDTLAVSQNRATFYNTQAEGRGSADAIHEAVYRLNRGLYLAMALLPGTQDFAKQQALLRTLKDTRYSGLSVLTQEQEAAVLGRVAEALPIQRQLKLFVAAPNKADREMGGLFSLVANRVNNARSRKLILRTILGHDNLPWIAVKYRAKVRAALEHAWGKKNAGVIRAILGKYRPDWADYEESFIQKNVFRFMPDWKTENAEKWRSRLEAVSFVLGNTGASPRTPFLTDILRAYVNAPTDFNALSKLPPEVAEGFRAKYHPGRTVGQVLEVTQDKATGKQAARMVAAAEKQGVEVTFNPDALSAAELYVYAYERGMTEEISQALYRKAQKAAQAWPIRGVAHVAVIVDASYGMRGSDTQKWRPIAAAMALADMLMETGESEIYFAGGREINGLQYPEGPTDLAPALLEALEDGAELVYLISDGYENAPAGRVAEVMALVRQAGITTPVYQLNPVFAGESFGARELAPGLVPVMALQKAEASTLAAVKQAFLKGDVEAGVRHVLRLTVPQALPEGEREARPQLVAAA